MVENEEGFLRESRRDWEKLGGGGAVGGVGAVGAVGGVGAVGAVGAVGGVGCEPHGQGVE